MLSPGLCDHRLHNATWAILTDRPDFPLFGPPVLLIANLFHPVGGFAVELFLDRDVRHGRGWTGSVPMLLSRREPDHVARTNFLNRTAPALCPAAAGRHDQSLAQRVRVPSCPSAGFERNTGADRARRGVRLEQRVNTHSAGEILGWSFAGRM